MDSPAGDDLGEGALYTGDPQVLLAAVSIYIRRSCPASLSGGWDRLRPWVQVDGRCDRTGAIWRVGLVTTASHRKAPVTMTTPVPGARLARSRPTPYAAL